jgi:hypothetical protein
MTTETLAGRYEALTNLTIGRGASDKEKAADIILRGETVTLTDEQAERFLHGHPVPVVRRAGESGALPQITARALFRPQPGPNQFGARPDPAGASRVSVNAADSSDPANHPEAQVIDVIDPDVNREGATQRNQARRPRA